SPTNAGSITVTIAFSEVVTGFTVADLSVVNGSISNLASTDSKTYTATLTPSANGLVTVNLAAGAAFDAANNGNTAAAPYSITFDTAPPTVAITTTASDPTSLTSIPITLTFNESVLGFTQSGVNVTNGTISNFVAVNETTYTFSIIPAASGLVTVRVLASSAHDAANNNNAETTFSITSNLVVPTVTITSSETSPTKAASIPVTVTFSEDVTGFTASSFTIANGTASGFVAVNGRSYTFSIVPTGDGAVTVNVAAGVAQSVSSSTGNAAGSFSITSDRTAPSAAITSSAASPTNLAAIPITIEFSEDVIGFTAAGLTATGGTIGDVVAVDGNTYTTTITPTGDGAVTVNVLAAAAHDAANNNNSASAAFSITSDRTAPMATITSSATSPTNLALIPITATFTEDVADFTAADLVVTNGAIGIITAVDGHTYTFSITPTADGPVTVQLAAGVVHDAAGNGNPVANFTINADVPPTASIATAANPTNAATIAMTVTFDEDVVNFSAAGVMVTNGTLSGFLAVNDRTYTFTVTPTADGLVTINVLAAAAQDAVGNNNAAATFALTSDLTIPTVAITSTASNPTNLATIPITIEFSEDVLDFSVANVNVTNGSLSDFVAVNGHTYTVKVAPALNGLVTVSVAAAAAHDAAGNTSTAGTFSITADRLAPSAAITSTVGAATDTASFPVSIVFNEDVTSFTAANVNVTNGVLSDFTKIDDHTYTATVTATAPGVVIVAIPAAVVQDGVGNDNAASSLSVNYDAAAPTVKSIIGNFSATSADANATTLLSGIFDDNSIGSSSVTFKILKGATAVDATLNLFDKDAPLTVANFLNYLDRYAAQGGTVFHRLHLENGLEIIQGGGYTYNASTVMLDQINTDAPIANEYSDLHQNTNGTIAMARTSDPNSATSEFFFNFKDTNASTLNASNSGGYAVFGVAATPADLAVIESLASIPIKNFGGALAEFPLLDGATVDTNNIIRVQQIVVNHRDDALTYSATSSNTSAATVALSGFQNNQLTLDYLAAGTTTITITATDKAGNAASTSFVVTVT
ncbi:MAG: Ig-like domain-containing protein, partial [Planctomycetota bacterium]